MLSQSRSSGHVYAAARSRICSATTRVTPTRVLCRPITSLCSVSPCLNGWHTAVRHCLPVPDDTRRACFCGHCPHTASPYSHTHDTDNVINCSPVVTHGHFCYKLKMNLASMSTNAKQYSMSTYFLEWKYLYILFRMEYLYILWNIVPVHTLEYSTIYTYILEWSTYVHILIEPKAGCRPLIYFTETVRSRIVRTLRSN
jgi:hypothetical protein